MMDRVVSLPELFLIASTRGMLGAGVGLLVADRLSVEQRRAIGWTLVGIGAITTIPLAFQVQRRRVSSESRAQTGEGRRQRDLSAAR